MTDPISIHDRAAKADVTPKDAFVIEALPAVQSAGGFAMTPVVVRKVTECPAVTAATEAPAAAPLPLPRVA